MTIETITSIELKDIAAVEFECGTCHTKIIYPIEKFLHPAAACNVCQPQKQFVIHGSSEFADYIKLGELIRRFSKTDPNLFRMRFELRKPDAA